MHFLHSVLVFAIQFQSNKYTVSIPVKAFWFWWKSNNHWVNLIFSTVVSEFSNFSQCTLFLHIYWEMVALFVNHNLFKRWISPYAIWKLDISCFPMAIKFSIIFNFHHFRIIDITSYCYNKWEMACNTHRTVPLHHQHWKRLNTLDVITNR